MCKICTLNDPPISCKTGGGGLVLQVHQEIGKVSHASSILRILLQYCISKLEILNIDLTCIGSMLLNAQVWWPSKVIHMEQHHIPICLLYGKLLCGRRYQGYPKNLQFNQSRICWYNDRLEEFTVVCAPFSTKRLQIRTSHRQKTPYPNKTMPFWQWFQPLTSGVTHMPRIGLQSNLWIYWWFAKVFWSEEHLCRLRHLSNRAC